MANGNLPPPARNGKPAPAATAPVVDPRQFTVSGGIINKPQRVVIYGTGGIGKSTLAALAPNPVFIDIEGGTAGLDVPRIDGVTSFMGLRSCIQSNIADGFDTIVLDSASKAYEWATDHTIATVKHEKGHGVSSVEGYGFGKGYQHVYDTFLLLLADLDSQIRRGRNVVVIAHSCVEDVPNPLGDDFIRFEPDLQSPRSGKASIRNRVVQWADHVLYLGYDVVVIDGKGIGTGTRTIWPTERPDHVAKSRSVVEEIPYNDPTDGTIWSLIFGGK